MTLNQLNYFKTVAEYENFHRAAEKLFVSQPSLSRSIASLESELGIPLFEKKGRRIFLTKGGKVFLEYAERILNECDIATNKMMELTQKGGRIDIGMVFPLAERYMPHIARQFLNKEENKDVNFRFYQNHTPAIIHKIKRGEIDVGFGGYTDNEESLEFYPVLKQEIVMITPKDYGFDEIKEVPISMLNEHPVVGYEKESWMGNHTHRLYRRLGLSPKIVVDCPDEHSIMAFVREGFGIALMPRVDSLDEDRINIHTLNDIHLAHQTFMFWEKERYHLPVVERFLEYMKKQRGGLEVRTEQ